MSDEWKMTGDGSQENTTEPEKPRYPWEEVLGTQQPKKDEETDHLKEAEGQPEEQIEEQPEEPSQTQTEVQSEEQINTENEKQAEDQTEMQPEQKEEADSSYHWVNPEYQKKQNLSGDSDQTQKNTYETQNYREDINRTAPEARTSEGQQNQQYHQQQGYQNGNWNFSGEQKNQSNPWNTAGEQKSQQGPVTGQRKYGDYTYRNREEKQPREKKPQSLLVKIGVTVLLAVLFGAIAGAVMFAVDYGAGEVMNTQEKVQIQLPTTELPNADVESDESAEVVEEKETQETTVEAVGEYTVAQVAKSCMPSVVSITNASVKTVQDFFGGVQEYPIESSGSGIIVGQSDSEILVATNNHVVAEADTITVAFNDDAVYEALVKGTDVDNDLAVIAVKISDISAETMQAIKVVRIGNSDNLEIGEQVVAIGNALGYGQSVTSGWISAVNRQMTDSDGKTTGSLIQTDAAINPGNSGGALLNMQGELIGINSAKAAATEVEGMGYAIPVSVAQPILDELMNRETRSKVDEAHAAYIGITCLNVDSTSAQTYGIPLGAFVDSVEEGGPAQNAGIQKGDVIVKFDGMTVSGSTDLVGKLEYYQAGETVDVVISRAQNGVYQEQTVSVTLGRRIEMKQIDPQAKR